MRSQEVFGWGQRFPPPWNLPEHRDPCPESHSFCFRHLATKVFLLKMMVFVQYFAILFRYHFWEASYTANICIDMYRYVSISYISIYFIPLCEVHTVFKKNSGCNNERTHCEHIYIAPIICLMDLSWYTFTRVTSMLVAEQRARPLADMNHEILFLS